MAFIKVHGLKLANGAFIENAVFESVNTPLTQEQINASAVGRTFFDLTENELKTVISDGQGGKALRSTGSVKYEPNLTSKILSAATSFQNADELLEESILTLTADVDGLTVSSEALRTDVDGLTTRTDDLRTDVDNLMSSKGSLSYTYKSSEAKDVHTITHDLDAEFIDVSVWVKDEDTGTYAIDLVNITEIDKNSIKVELSGAYNIKSTIRRANPIV